MSAARHLGAALFQERLQSRLRLFVALRDGFPESRKLEEDLCAFVAERLTTYKQPREIRFVDSIPKSASGKILRRELRKSLT